MRGEGWRCGGVRGECRPAGGRGARAGRPPSSTCSIATSVMG